MYQVMFNGQQSVVLDSQGSAIGGTVVINAHLSQNLGNLVIPKGVTVIDMTKTGTLNLSGNLVDDGSLYVVAKNPAMNNGAVSIGANNITVQSLGLISDVLPVGNSGASGTNQNAVLNVNTQNNITNSGTISSGGSLNLSAGSGTIVNSGTISSTSGSINIADAGAAAINVNGSGGTFQAQNGNINVRDASYNGAGNINLSGGNFLSNNLNLYSGTGTASTFVNSINGLLNVNAGQAHTLVSAGNLQLGTLALLGDPTFYNTNGNITIGGNISVGEAFSAVASENILSTGNYSILANNGTSGFQINLIAGANISAPGSTPSSIVGPFTFPPSLGIGTQAVNPITISGASATGGNVTFSGRNMTISSAAPSGNGSGGDVNVIAFSNAAGTSGGQVLLSSGTTINSGGSGIGANGNIRILAGAGNGVAISTGSLNSTGGTGGGGDIQIQTSQPTTGANPITINPNGDLAVGSNFAASSTTNPASVTVNAPITSGGNVKITSANTVAVNYAISANTAGKTITIQSPNNLTVTGTGSLSTSSTGKTSLLAMSAGSSLTVGSETNLSINGGGEVDIRTPNLVLAGNNPTIAATGASNIFIDAGNSAANVDFNITGPSRSSGTIATNGGIIDVSPTGLGNGNFLNSGGIGTTINLNASGSNGPGLVDVHGLGNFTIPKGVTLSSNSPIQFNMNNTLGNQTFTLNGTLTTTASNAPFPDPLGGSLYYSILIQNLITNYNIAGTGTILQAGKTPGNTVFNDFTDVGFQNGTNLHITSLYSGSYANFFTRQIQVNGTGSAGANLTLKNVNAVNFNTNLPSFGPGDVAFVGSPTTTSAKFTITGAPANVGFQGTPPISIPAAQQPVANITIGKNFELVANNSISFVATNLMLVLGSIYSSGGSGQLTAQSPAGQSLAISGSGVLQSPLIALSSPSGPGVNFSGAVSLFGRKSYINAPDGAVTIASGSSVRHSGHVLINSPAGIPSGFVPSGGVVQTNAPFPNPSNGAVSIISPNLTILGSITAQRGFPIPHNLSSSNQVAAPTQSASPTQFTASTPATASTQFTSSTQTSSSTQSAAPNRTQIATQASTPTQASVRNQSTAPNQTPIATQSSLPNQGSGLTKSSVSTPDHSIAMRGVQTLFSSAKQALLPSRTQSPLQGRLSVNSAKGEALFMGTAFTTTNLNKLENQGIVFGQQSNGNFIDLVKGNMLFMPENDIRVQTGAGIASVPKGAAAWIMETGNTVAIYDLHDNGRGGRISVTVDNKMMALSPGTQVLVTKDKSSNFDSLNPGKTIAYRNVRESKSGEGKRVFLSDFSINHGLANVSVVRNLLESSDASQRKAAWAMLKDAAILADLTGAEYQ